jgi:hypothetical protein
MSDNVYERFAKALKVECEVSRGDVEKGIKLHLDDPYNYGLKIGKSPQETKRPEGSGHEFMDYNTRAKTAFVRTGKNQKNPRAEGLIIPGHEIENVSSIKYVKQHDSLKHRGLYQISDGQGRAHTAWADHDDVAAFSRHTHIPIEGGEKVPKDYPGKGKSRVPTLNRLGL